MIGKQKGDIAWLEFSLLQPFPELVHGFFLRKGGVSAAPFHSLNVAKRIGDDEEAVACNRRLVCDVLGIEQLMEGTPVHGATIRSVLSSGFDQRQICDGLVTQAPGIGLLVSNADCQAALFFDPIRRVVANVHCGWRGSVGNIYANAVMFLHAEYGSDPQDLIVCISPSLGPRAGEMIHYEQELPKTFLPFKRGKCHFDFWAIAKWQLEKAGVQPHHIEIAERCTVEEEEFFSFRREKKTGRHATVIALKKS